MAVTLNASTSSGFVQAADTSGTVEIQSNGTTKFTVATTGAYGQVVSGTAVASTSGTSIDFTSIPSWVKRVTVMFNGVSTNGTSSFLVQIGSGSITSSGYNSVGAGCINAAPPLVASSTAGFILVSDTATDVRSGALTINLVGSNVYIANHTQGGIGGRNVVWWGGGSVTLSGTLDRVRITTVGGTDTFDAGSINILYEG